MLNLTKRLLTGIGITLFSAALLIFRKSDTEEMEDFISGKISGIQKNKGGIGLKMIGTDQTVFYAVLYTSDWTAHQLNHFKLGQVLALKGKRTRFSKKRPDKRDIIEVKALKHLSE